jgi:hypothetical protein
MKPLLLLAGVLSLSFGSSHQNPGVAGMAKGGTAPASRPQDAKSGPKIPEADIKKLADALQAVIVTKDDFKNHDAARKQLAAEVERIDKTIKPASILSMPEVWNDVYYAKREKSIQKAPSGLGRVEEKKLSTMISGKSAEFKYGLLLPNQYDVKKRYPLLIALHDKPVKDREASGSLYLNEVWMKAPKEVRDQFIIIAPSMGPGALGKDFRVEWGDLNHIKTVALPLQEMLLNYPVDFDRVYLEGTGEGGEFAMHLALLSPHRWAGVAARSALPRFPQLLANGGNLPISINLRAGSPLSSSPVKGVVEQHQKTLGLPLEIKDYPAAEKAVKGPFEGDVLLEASGPIATFLASKKREIAPKKITFITDGPNLCYWTRLAKFEPDSQYTTKLSGEVGVADNTISLNTQGIEELKLYLTDRLINMDQPVKLNVNGQPHTERQFTRSLDVLLKYFESNPSDPGIQPTAAIESIKVAVATGTDSNPAPTDSKPKTESKPK